MLSDILRSAEVFGQIKRRESWSPERLRAHQLDRLKETLAFAAREIPFYRESFQRAGFFAEDVQSWEDLSRVPFLQKTEVRSRPPQDFLPRGIDPAGVWKTQTTGSSGIPITVFRNRESVAWEKAFMHYGFSSLGIGIHHRFCQISAITPEKLALPGPLARLGLKRHFAVSLKQTDDRIADEIVRIKPQVIYTFPSVFLRLAEYIKLRRIRPGARRLVAQGEVLPESWRKTIEDAFGAPLYHTYGATEIARIGFECREQRGFHLIADAAAVEVLSGGRPAAAGEEGDLVVTNLNNFCMPFIRYKIGDKGILNASPCPCGIRYPRLESVTGRADDYLVLPSGRKISARAVTHMQFGGILQYKIVQKTPFRLHVLVVPSPSFGAETVAEIRRVLSGALLGETIDVEIIRSESLPVSRTGKLQLVSREF